MIVCKKCHGNCDTGEVIGGICLECLEKEQQNVLRNTRVIKMLNSPFYQMELNLEEMCNGR